jgi:tetratricopeptide (TPR) repeat protein
LFERDIASDGIEKATANFNERRADDPKGIYYLDFYEMSALAEKLFAENTFELGKTVLALISQCFPGTATTYGLLARACMKQNKKTEALQALEKTIALKEKKYSPQSRQFNDYMIETLIKEYLAGGIGALDRQYLGLKGKYPLLVTERLLNSLGYLFLGIKLTQPAIEVLDLNVKKFPQSANVYDSLGEAYMNAGDKEHAIENYEKSLTLNPQNTNAAEKIKELRTK